MDFILQYRWIFIVLGVILFFKLFGKSKGGTVVSRVRANLQVLDPRFQTCEAEATYKTFKEGQPHKIDIDIEKLPLQPGEVLDFHINNKQLANVTVDRKLEAEFEHWNDEEVDFPQINAGDKLDILYQNNIVLSGVFVLVN